VKQLVFGFYRRILTAHHEHTPRCVPALTERSCASLKATLRLARALLHELEAIGPDEHC
jgi:hypothetical protein